MDDLIFYGALLDHVDDRKATKDLSPDPVIVQIRQRLLSSSFGDSVETRIDLLAELVFRTYIHQLQLWKERP